MKSQFQSKREEEEWQIGEGNEQDPKPAVPDTHEKVDIVMQIVAEMKCDKKREALPGYISTRWPPRRARCVAGPLPKSQPRRYIQRNPPKRRKLIDRVAALSMGIISHEPSMNCCPASRGKPKGKQMGIAAH